MVSYVTNYYKFCRNMIAEHLGKTMIDLTTWNSLGEKYIVTFLSLIVRFLPLSHLSSQVSESIKVSHFLPELIFKRY